MGEVLGCGRGGIGLHICSVEVLLGGGLFLGAVIDVMGQ